MDRWSPWRLRAQLKRHRTQQLQVAAWAVEHRHEFYDVGPVRVHPYIRVVVAELPIDITEYRALMGRLEDQDMSPFETPLVRFSDEDIRASDDWLLIDGAPLWRGVTT